MEKKNFRIIFELKQKIEVLDRLIFENNSIPVKIVSPKGKNTIAEYVLGGKDEEECYLVVKNPDHVILNNLNLRAKGLTKRPFSKEALIVGLAAHEVRHRVQNHFQIDLLYDISFEPEIETIKDPDLKSAISFVEELYHELILNGVDLIKVIGLAKWKEEFDAEAMGNFVARKWRGDNFSEIAKIIRTKATDLRAM